MFHGKIGAYREDGAGSGLLCYAGRIPGLKALASGFKDGTS